MGDLKRDAPQKAKWGIEQGFIKSASPIVPVTRDGFDGFDGFYFEAESSSGSHDFVGGLVHSSRKTEVIQVTFIGSKTEAARAMFEKVFGSVSLADTNKH